MRFEMMCRPPENRSSAASSAARTVVLPTSTLASSSLTSAVNATRESSLLLATQVAVLHAHVQTGERVEPASELFDDRNGSVLAARAAQSDRSVAFVLASVPG